MANETPDAVEIWAKRVGRGLGFVALAMLVLYLIGTWFGQ